MGGSDPKRIAANGFRADAEITNLLSPLMTGISICSKEDIPDELVRQAPEDSSRLNPIINNINTIIIL